VVDPLQPISQIDAELLTVPKDLALLFQEIANIYNYDNKQNIVDCLKNLISEVREDKNNSLLKDQIKDPIKKDQIKSHVLSSYPIDSAGQPHTFLNKKRQIS
jgi:hypothetical protein